MSNDISKAAKARAEAIHRFNIIEEEYNKFTDVIFRLYDACYVDAPDKFIVNKKDKYANTKKYFILQECESIIRTLSKESPDFDTLYEFASFIKYIEKVFFYKNDINAMISCDSQLDDNNTRVLIFRQNEDVLIQITMNKAKRSIDIITYRYFGKNMKFGYTIIDRKADFKDKSDVVLMNNIVLTMEKMMSTFFLHIVLAVANNNIDLSPLEIKFKPDDFKDIDICIFIKEYHELCKGYNGEEKLVKTPEYKFIEKLLKKHIIP